MRRGRMRNLRTWDLLVSRTLLKLTLNIKRLLLPLRKPLKKYARSSTLFLVGPEKIPEYLTSFMEGMRR
jgi:hypothetical protein